MNPEITDDKILMDITFQQLLDCDLQTLTRIFRRFLQIRVTSDDAANRDEAEEIMFLMEGAPELKNHVNLIHGQMLEELQKEKERLKKKLNLATHEKLGITGRLLELKNLCKQKRTEKEEKEKKRNNANLRLEQKKYQVKKAETHEKRKWIASEAQWNQRIKQMQERCEEVKRKWEQKKDLILTLCREFNREIH
jgi:chromosome segregation ATPase